MTVSLLLTSSSESFSLREDWASLSSAFEFLRLMSRPAKAAFRSMISPSRALHAVLSNLVLKVYYRHLKISGRSLTTPAALSSATFKSLIDLYLHVKL